MKGVPWEPVPGSENTEIRPKVNLEDRSKEVIQKEREEGEEEVHNYRRASIKRKDVEEIGLTPGCRGCISINRKQPGGKSIEHNEECRKKHETRLRRIGDARIVQQDYRLLKVLSEEGEKVGKKRKIEETITKEVNEQGGVHVEGGSASSGTLQRPMEVEQRRERGTRYQKNEASTGRPRYGRRNRKARKRPKIITIPRRTSKEVCHSRS